MPATGVLKKQHDNILSYEALFDIVSEAVDMGIDKVRITGGEPLVRKDLVPFIARLRTLEGIKTLTMTTNAILLGRYAEALADAGLDRVNISLDTLDPDRYREMTRGGRLEDALAGIEAARRAGLTPVKINTVLIKGFNDDEIDRFIAFSRGDVEVRFIELMPIGEAASWSVDRFLSGKALLDNRENLIALDDKGDGPARYYTKRDGTGRVGLIDPISDHFCATCNRIRMTADGRLKPCLHDNREIDVASAVGNVEEIRWRLASAILEKPERHRIEDPGFIPITRDMYKIGG
jgi:cyclic pyranopterin phosphate synthase